MHTVKETAVCIFSLEARPSRTNSTVQIIQYMYSTVVHLSDKWTYYRTVQYSRVHVGESMGAYLSFEEDRERFVEESVTLADVLIPEKEEDVEGVAQ